MAEAVSPCWQLKFENVEQRCGYLLTSGIWSDCTFEVGTETNQVKMPAHKLVLAMASPVFETIFYGELSERNELKISDVQPEAFTALLRKFFIYIYTGKADIASFDMAWGLLYGAKKYKLPYLVQECSKYICSVLTPGNVCRAYQFALLYDEKTLMDKCIQKISTNTKEVLKAGSFEDIELNTLITVFSLDHLNVDSELDLFDALKNYAEAERRRQGQICPPEDVESPSEKLSEPRLEPQTTEEKVLQSVASSSQTSPAAELHSKTPTGVVTSGPTAAKENLKEVPEKERPSIRAAVAKIRFLSLSAQEFAAGPARSALLTQDEAFAVLMNIASADCAEPMPPGFSKRRDRRQPPSDFKDQCFEVGRLDHLINELKRGNPAQVEAAALATTSILITPPEIQHALDKGMLNALGAALTNGNYKCKFYATLAIRNICGSGSPAQLRVLGASAALEPYCRLLTDTGTRSWVLRGLADLLKKVEENNKPALLTKLREIGVIQLLKFMSKDEAKRSGENLADEIIAIMNSEGIQSADDIADATGSKNTIRDESNLKDMHSQTTDTVQSAKETPTNLTKDLSCGLPSPVVLDHLPPIAPQALKPFPTSSTIFKLREYDANKHCGVVTADGKPCMRSLVCKAHAVSLRRAVEGRAKPFDTLLAERRASAGPAPLLANNSNLSSFNGLTTDQQVNDISLAAPLDGPFALPVPVERIKRPERTERK